MLVLLVVIGRIMHADGSGKRWGPLTIVHNTCICMVIFSVVEVLKTVGCRLLSLRALSEKLFSVLRVCRPSSTSSV